MQLSLPARALRALLADARAISKKRHSLPVLQHVILRAEPNTLRIECTDMNLSLIGTEPAQVAATGAAVVPYAAIATLAERLNDDIRLDSRGWDTILRSGTSRYQLRGLPLAEYPALVEPPTEASFTISGETLRAAITATLYATTADHTSWLSCARMQNKQGQFSLMGADGARLAGYRAELEGAPDVLAVIPRPVLEEAASLLKGVADPVELAIGEQTMRLATPIRVLVARLFGGPYGSIDSVIPVSSQHQGVVEREALLEALQRATAILPEAEANVTCTLKEGQLTLAAAAPGASEGTEQVASQTTGEPITWRVNGNYLVSALKVFPGKHVSLNLNGPLLPIRLIDLQNPEYISVVMPVNFA